MNKKILEILKSNKENFVSGENLSKELNVSRMAICKHINFLREQGYEIDSSTKKGYKLSYCPDIMTSDEIDENLNTKFIGRNIIHFAEIESTNTYAKQIGEKSKDGTVVICERQTSGRGRLGRYWQSQEGSICMTIILKPDISIFETAKLTQVCAASVSKALEDMEIQVQIKWPNDLSMNNKKICGILTEMNSEINKVNYVVIGIGLNVNNSHEEFPIEIRDIATSIKKETGKEFKKNIIAAKIINNFEILYNEFVSLGKFDRSLDICRQRSSVIGKDINVIKNCEYTYAKVLNIGDNGELIVEYKNGKKESLISGEISIRRI